MAPEACFRGFLYLAAMWWIAVGHSAPAQEELRGPTDFDFETIHAFTRTGEPGLLIALVGDPSLQASRLQMSYRLNNQQAFQAKFMACNHTTSDPEYDFFVLIDYRQQTFDLDGNAADAHRVFLSKGDCKVSVLGVQPPGAGSHDMILAGIRRQSDQSIASPPDFGLIAHRATLMVGGEERFPEQTPLDVSDGKYLPSGEDLRLYCLPSQHADDDKRPSPVYLTAANPHAQGLEIALVLFANKTQVRVTDADDEQSSFLTIAPQTTAQIKIGPSLTRPDAQLWALMIENPYTVLEPHRGVMAQLPAAVKRSNTLDREICEHQNH